MNNNILTINIEDYYQVGAFSHLIPYREWERFEDRIRRNTETTLELLSDTNAKATFFVSGWIAEKHPDMFRSITASGHEIAAQGYYQQSIRNAPPNVFRDDVRRSKQIIEAATGRQALGFRVGRGWIGPDDLWALDILAQEGFTYDASICPRGRQFRREPDKFALHTVDTDNARLIEVPVSALRLLGHAVPFAGGNYLRQLPKWLTRRAAASWTAQRESPLVMYFHIWELDHAQPDITAANLVQRLRHYRNLLEMRERIRYFLERYRFTSVQNYLHLSQERISPATAVSADRGTTRDGVTLPSTANKTFLSVVIPCFNEEASIAYLARTLSEFRVSTAANARLEFVLVDDGSSDTTWAGLEQAFAHLDDHILVRHRANQGIAAAILTGARHCSAELIAVIDADCTFDPVQITQMIPLLADEVTAVVASPFHDRGTVRNVPTWRLLLSRTASALYRTVMHNKLSSYTSCFRLYRREAIATMSITNGGFCGVTEILARLDLAGHTVVECPAELQVRLLGQSKIKLLRVILDHLRLITRIAASRFFAAPFPRGHIPQA